VTKLTPKNVAQLLCVKGWTRNLIRKHQGLAIGTNLGAS
jgi:hypothetical protein